LNKYLIVSGDPSGDIHAANLMREIKILAPDSRFYGIGGPNMISEGLYSIAEMSEVAVVGFWEVAKKYSFFKGLLDKCKDIIKKEKIDAFIPIDYPGFNIRLAEISKQLGIKVYYYIAPQLWAWGKNRAKKLAKVADKLMVVFPFEVEYFSKYGIETTFVGHPLLDNPDFSKPIKPFKDRNTRIAFFPGSRSQEVTKHLNLFNSIYEYNQTKNYNFEFIIAKSNNIPLDAFVDTIKFKKAIISEDNISIMQNSSAGIIKTGTSNLEAALCGLPFAMFYKTSYMTYNIARNLVNLPYISIINILSGKFVIKEFIQNDANPVAILDYIDFLVKNPDVYDEIQDNYNNIRKILGPESASKNTANIIVNN
jgi:lipid-A-disaccharide synthase